MSDWLQSWCHVQGLGFHDFGHTFKNWACWQFRVSAGQVGQECTGQQIGWTYQQSLNLHLKRFKCSIFVISAVISFPFCLKKTLNFEIIIVPQLLQQTYCTALAPSIPFLDVKESFLFQGDSSRETGGGL